MIWGKVFGSIATAVAVTLALSSCVSADNLSQNNDVVKASDQIQDAEATEATEAKASKSVRCEEFNKSSSFELGIGNSESAEPFGGPRGVPWAVSDFRYRKDADLDTAREGVFCFRSGLISKISESQVPEIQAIESRLLDTEHGLELLYFIPLEDLFVLADLLVWGRNGSGAEFDVESLIQLQASSPFESKEYDQLESSVAASPSAAPGADCAPLGAQQTVNGKLLECRLSTGRSLKWVDTTGVALVELSGTLPVDWDQCRIRDQRREVRALGTAFNIDRHIRMENPRDADLAIIPIDFPDAVATQSLDDFLGRDVETFNQLINQWAGDNQQYRWHLPEEWIRMPKEAAFYNHDHFSVEDDGSRVSDGFEQLMSTEEQAYDIFSAAEQVMDLNGIDFAFIISWPDRAVHFAPYSSGGRFSTERGSYSFPFYGFGTQILQDPERRPLWHFLLHELLHFRGLAGHGPRQGNLELFFNVMASGQSLYAWDAFLMDWFEEDQVLCFDADDLQEATFTLASTDNSLDGPRAAIIRLSSTRVLVLETRRRGEYNDFLPEGFAALHAYEIDSTKSGERTPEEIHGVYLEIVSSSNQTIPGVRDSARRFGTNVSGFPGDTFIYENLVVTYLETGTRDRIRVERVD